MHWLLVALIACGQKTSVETPENTSNGERSTEQDVTSTPTEFEQYGGEFTITDTIPASQLLADPEKYVGQKVRVSGTVSDVCQKMGCWMVISEDDKHMRVTTKAHKFFVAKDGAGSQCDIEGSVIKREANKERSEHFASEKSEGAPVPEGEVTNTATYEIVAEAIRFQLEASNTVPGK